MWSIRLWGEEPTKPGPTSPAAIYLLRLLVLDELLRWAVTDYGNAVR